MEAKGDEDETKDAKEEEPPSKVVIDLLTFAMKVVHEEMSGILRAALCFMGLQGGGPQKDHGRRRRNIGTACRVYAVPGTD